MSNQYSLEVGDSFELSNGYGTHLHVIIAAESSSDHSQLILVYLSSKNTIYKDSTTIIKPGEHPYVTRTDVESWIRYQNTRVCSRDSLMSEITNHYGKISDDLLKRIQDGFLLSKNVPRILKQLFHEWKMNQLIDSL